METPKSNDPPSPGKPDLEGLLLSIVGDDRVTARKMIAKAPALSAASVDHARLYETSIFHWLYERDTALHLAAAGHRAVIAEMLLAAGADPNSACNHRRSRPLHYAADGRPGPFFQPDEQVKTIRSLLKAGADLHAADKNGATPLHRAVRTRSAAAVEFLLLAGSDPAARNLPGATPFHLAVQNTGRGGSGAPESKVAQRRIIESMLAHDVSPKMKDGRGKSVLDWATSEWVQQLLTGGERHADDDGDL